MFNAYFDCLTSICSCHPLPCWGAREIWHPRRGGHLNKPEYTTKHAKQRNDRTSKVEKLEKELPSFQTAQNAWMASRHLQNPRSQVVGCMGSSRCQTLIMLKLRFTFHTFLTLWTEPWRHSKDVLGEYPLPCLLVKGGWHCFKFWRKHRNDTVLQHKQTR